MVKIALQIKATLECIQKLYTNHPYYQWFLKLKCSSCGEVSEKFHDLTEADKVAQKHNRSETNLLIKCKLCARENSIDIIEGSNGSLTNNDEGKFKTLVIFDCRGVELVDFEPKSGWIAEAEDGAILSFHNGSAGGLDGISPQHLKDLVSVAAGDAGRSLLSNITRLCNIMLSGKKFEDVDLTEKEWVEYDEKNQTSVGVYELEWQFIKVK